MDTYANRVITIGKLKITLPSLIVAVAGLVLAVVASIAVNIWAGLGTALVMFIASFNVNCAVVGHCTTWAWLLTSIYFIYAILVIIAVPFATKDVLKRL